MVVSKELLRGELESLADQETRVEMWLEAPDNVKFRIVGAALCALIALPAAETAADPVPVADASTQSENEEDGDDVVSFFSYPSFTIIGFGNVAVVGEERPVRDGDRLETSSRARTDLFLLGELSDRFAIFGQVALAVEEGGTDDVRAERLQLKYVHSELFELRLGKFHTPLGYWNRAYHDVAWLRPTILRPEIYRLEGDGGILPLRSVGVMVTGVAHFEKIDLGYSLGAASGRKAALRDGVELDDVGDVDGLNLQLTFGRNTASGKTSRRPDHRDPLRDFELGVHAWVDTIPSGSSLGGRGGEIDEQILGAFLYWKFYNIEAIGEYLWIDHDDQLGGTSRTEGWYYQISSIFGSWQLYQRTDRLDFDQLVPDRYFASLDTRDLTKFTAGVRWDPRQWLGVSVEYHFSDRDGARGSDGFGLQLAFSPGTYRFGD